MEQSYRTSIRAKLETSELPDSVNFHIDETSAREIVRLAALVKAHGLYKVEKFDFRACYTRSAQFAAEEIEAAQADRTVLTEADCLNVGESTFWFSAYLKHTDTEISSEALSIAELKESFGLSA